LRSGPRITPSLLMDEVATVPSDFVFMLGAILSEFDRWCL
jgi:hypothetical protein